MKRISIFLILIFLLSFNMEAQDTLLLRDAIDIGLENNYTIRIARNASEIARNSNTLGNAGFLPQVNANYNNNNGVTTSKTILASGGIREGHNVKTHNVNANALVNWTIFDGFNMFINKQKLDELQRAGEYQARMNVENTVSQIIISYYAIVQQQKMLKVIQEALELSDQRLKLAQSMKNIGAGSEQAILQAMVDANADSTRLLQQINLIKNSKADLNRLLAREANVSLEVKDNLQLNETLEFQVLQERFNNQNAQVLVQRANVNLAEYTIGNYRSQYMPTVSLFGGYNYIKNITPVGAASLSQSNGLTYGLTASLNIFNGGVTSMNMQNSKLLLKSSQYQYEDIKLMLQNELYKYYNNYTTNLQLVKIQRSNVEIAKKDVEIAVGRYKLGNITDIDLRVTQQKLIDAENNLLSAEYNAKQSEIELQRLSGQLLNVLP